MELYTLKPVDLDDIAKLSTRELRQSIRMGQNAFDSLVVEKQPEMIARLAGMEALLVLRTETRIYVSNALRDSATPDMRRIG